MTEETNPTGETEAQPELLPLDALEWREYRRKAQTCEVAVYTPDVDPTGIELDEGEQLDAGDLIMRGPHLPRAIAVDEDALEEYWELDEDPPPRYAVSCNDLKPIHEARATCNRLNAELRALDPWGSTYANHNQKVAKLQVDLNMVDALTDALDTAAGLIALMRHSFVREEAVRSAAQDELPSPSELPPEGPETPRTA